MNKILFILLAVILTAPLVAFAKDTKDLSKAITNYTPINEELSSGGLITDPQVFQTLSQNGYTTIIDFRSIAEGGQDQENQDAATNNLKYISIPTSGTKQSLYKSAEIFKGIYDGLALLNNDKTIKNKALLHCRSGNRVGAIWAIYNLQQGKSLDEAIQMGRAAGMQPNLEQLIK